MATSKQRKTAASLPSMPVPRAVTPPGEPTGAFLRTLERARKAGLDIDDYDITADLVLHPLTQARSKALAAASAAHLLAQTAAVKLVQDPESPPAPPRPLPNQIARELDELANKVKKIMSRAEVASEVIEEMIVAIRVVGADISVLPAGDGAEYDEYLRQFKEYTRMREGYPARQLRELEAVRDQADEATNAYTEALLGDAEDNRRVQEFFAERPEWEHEAFVQEITTQFLRLPDDGKCKACGHVDPKALSSALTSAIGSNTTSTNSTPISPSSSEPTSTTGGEEPDLGSSSPVTSDG